MPLEHNHTWSLIPLPLGHKTIGCRWVYKIKYNSNSFVEGHTQVEGIDYKETFSPTTRLTTLCCLLTIVAARKWFTHQLDVQNVFLHGNLDKEVYMSLSPGLRRQE